MKISFFETLNNLFTHIVILTEKIEYFQYKHFQCNDQVIL